jgi:predicted RNase H-like HicB family nuclease
MINCYIIRVNFKDTAMEKLLNINIEKLPEGLYLATSEELQGLVAQGRTVAETLEIARDVARKLLEAQLFCVEIKDAYVHSQGSYWKLLYKQKVENN